MQPSRASQFGKEGRREMYEILRAQLENERTSFLSHWRDLAEYILPRRPRFTLTDNNRGDRRNQKIVNSTATQSMRTLRSGMMGGVTSPARPWFRLTHPDAKTSEVPAVKQWLYDVTQQMVSVFLRSNLYKSLPAIYSDIGCFATGALFVEKDYDRVIHTTALPIGSYMLACDDKGKVNVFFREFRMTVRQVVKKFGGDGPEPDFSNMSDHIKKLWNDGHREHWIDICHCIKPNEQHDKRRIESKFKKFSSCYYEKGTQYGGQTPGYQAGPDQLLSEMGYDYFPVLVPRWETTDGDAYGTNCPGMEVLGDVKALQIMERRKAEAVEKMVRPPMTGPSSLRQQKVTILPGDITYNDESSGQGGFKPTYQIEPRVQELAVDIQNTEQRIKKGCYEDVILAITSMDRKTMTATEVEERREEKLVSFGPALEQLNQDLLDPLIDMTFNLMVELDMVPEAPEELQAVALKVEYISVMHQAQKMVGVAGVERFVNFVLNMGALTKDPRTIRKLNTDQTVDVYGDMLSVPPGLVRSDDEIDQMEVAEQKAAKEAQMAERATMAAGAARDLAGADMTGDNALTRLAAGNGQQVVQ